MSSRILQVAGIIYVSILAGCVGANQSPTKLSVGDLITRDLESRPDQSNSVEPDRENLPSTRYISDKDHSSISFRTGHWEIVDLIGWFEEFQVVMYADSADFSDAVIYAEVDPTSIRMPNLKMAQTAIKAPYIDSEMYPVVSFESTAIYPRGDENFTMDGIFHMNGVKRLATFEVAFHGYAYPGEKSICGFHAIGKINRHDFKVAGDDQLHSGRAVHSDTIEIKLDLRME